MLSLVVIYDLLLTLDQDIQLFNKVKERVEFVSNVNAQVLPRDFDFAGWSVEACNEAFESFVRIIYLFKFLWDFITLVLCQELKLFGSELS